MTPEHTTKMLLLELEVEALRSVLSEYETDHYEYTQMHKADDLRRVIGLIDLEIKRED